MDIQNWLNWAAAGDAEAMLEVVNQYIAAENWDEAICWADRAAETGDADALYKAAILHHLRMEDAANSGDWPAVRADSRAAQKHAGTLSRMMAKGSLDVSAGLRAVIRDTIRDALYGEALAFFQMDADYGKAADMLRPMDTTRERLLYGLCLFEMNCHHEAIRQLRSAVEDGAYSMQPGQTAEQRVWSRAVFVLSIMERMEADNCRRAAAVLQQGIRKVHSDEMARPLKAELNRYHQTAQGKWLFE